MNMSYPFIQPLKERDNGIENQEGNFKKNMYAFKKTFYH